MEEEEEVDEVKRLGLRPKVEPLRFPPFDKVRLIHRQPSNSDMVSFKRGLDTVSPSCYTAYTRSRAHQVYTLPSNLTMETNDRRQ